MSWPARYHEEIVEAARVLDLSVLEASEVVRKYGVQAAGAESRHHNEAFRPIIANALIALGRRAR